jgi:hypothetical protein
VRAGLRQGALPAAGHRLPAGPAQGAATEGHRLRGAGALRLRRGGRGGREAALHRHLRVPAPGRAPARRAGTRWAASPSAPGTTRGCPR